MALKTLRAVRLQVNTFISKERARLDVELIPTEPGIKEDIWELRL